MATRSIAVLLCVLVVLAGCVGGNGGGTDGTTTTAAPGGNGGGGSGGGSGGGGSGNAGEWDPYKFRQGEFYRRNRPSASGLDPEAVHRYEMFEAGERVGELSWDVQSVSADGQTVTVAVSGEFEGESFSTTTTGTPETLYSNLLMSPAGSIVFVALYSPFVGAFQGEELAVGGGWEFSDGQTTVSYRIERTDSIAGRDVFVSVIRENGTAIWETWIDTELAFAAKTVIYDGGEVNLEVRLLEYRRT